MDSKEKALQEEQERKRRESEAEAKAFYERMRKQREFEEQSALQTCLQSIMNM